MLLFPRPAALALALAAIGASGGCCSLAALWCGPDESPWVSVDYRTPEAAVATFLEAIRRDKPKVIYEALSESAKDRYGLGVVEGAIAWEKLRSEVTGLHLAGSARVLGTAREPDGRVRFELELAGRRFTLRVVEQPFWEVSWTDPDDGTPRRAGKFVADRQLRSMLVVQNEDEPALAFTVRDPLLPDVRATQLREGRFGRMWKIDEIEGFVGFEP